VAQVYSLVQCSNLISIEAHGRDFEVKFFSLRKVNEAGLLRQVQCGGPGAMAVSHFVHGKHGAYQMAIWLMFQLYGLAWCAGHTLVPCSAMPRRAKVQVHPPLSM